MGAIVFTVGHSTHSCDVLLDLLDMHSVTAVADVRSTPFSRVNPQFNRPVLARELEGRSIDYAFLGQELGARSEDPTCYVNGQVQYDRLAGTKPFQQGLDRVLKGVARYSIALLCAEKDPLTCHRGILVARHLAARGVEVRHLREDGSVEYHDEMLNRLLAELKLPEADLFRTREEILDDAYELRGNQIAYVQPDPGNDDRIEAAAG